MPTYDYRCNACKHEFELFQSITAPVKRKCPECGKNQLERLIGIGSAVLFKGSGFYETDYRSESYKKAQTDETNAGAKPESKGEAKPDTKSDSGSPKTADSAAKADGAKKPVEKTASKPTGATDPKGGSSNKKASKA